MTSFFFIVIIINHKVAPSLPPIAQEGQGSVLVTSKATNLLFVFYRQTKITLKCDPSNNGSVGPATFTGTPSGPSTTIYVNK